MPVIAPILAFAGSAAGAATIAGGIGAAGSLYAANQANKASKKQITAQQQADQRNYELQQQALNQSQQNNAPFMQAGYGALDQLAQRFGLGGMGGSTTSAAPGGSTASGGTDWNAYLNTNPDAQAWVNSVRGTVNDPTGGSGDDAALAAYHWQADGSRRPLTQTAPQTAAPAQETGTGANYGPSVEQIGTRQTYTRPDVGQAPALPSLSAEAYRASPGFENRLRQAGRNTNAQFAARGILQSGAAAEEFGKRMQNIADEDYDAWAAQQLGIYDRQLGQYNQDRNRLDSIYSQDRAFGTGVYDADRNYLTSRFDQNVSDLFNLAGIGQNAAARQSAAQSNYATNVGNQANTSANTLSDIYGNQASNNAAAWGNIAGIGQNLLTNWGGRGGSGSGSNNNLNWSQNWGGGS